MDKLNENYPKISVVVACLDDGPSLERTLSSIVEQKYPNYELVIIDRGSGYGTTKIINEFKSGITHFETKKSFGYFQALQKGFEECHGEYMTWIDPGAAFMSNAFWAIRNICKNHYDIKWLTGMSVFINKEGAAVVDRNFLNLRWTKEKFLASDISQVRRCLTGGNVFWRKSLWEENGGSFDLQFEILADLKLWEQFFSKETLYSAMIYLAEVPFIPFLGGRQLNRALEKEMQQIRQGFVEPRKSWLNQKLDTIYYRCYQLDVPFLKNKYLQLNLIPGLIRYDYESDSFYLSMH